VGWRELLRRAGSRLRFDRLDEGEVGLRALQVGECVLVDVAIDCDSGRGGELDTAMAG
jgi:hypothetical protein